MAEVIELFYPSITEKRIENIIQLLYLISKTENTGYLGVTKIQKLTFLTEYHQKKEGIEGFDLNFFRWEYGPMSKEVYKGLKLLEKSSLIIKKHGDYKSTEKGLKILRELNSVIQNNSEVFRKIDDIIAKFGEKSGGYLKNYIYNNFTVGGRKLKDVEIGTDLIMPEPKEGKIKVTKDWLDTFEIYLDIDLNESLNKALMSAKTEKLKRYTGLSE